MPSLKAPHNFFKPHAIAGGDFNYRFGMQYSIHNLVYSCIPVYEARLSFCWVQLIIVCDVRNIYCFHLNDN